jgi:exodeoxyribonuclease VII small subunit
MSTPEVDPAQTYEQARAELEDVVRRLEAGGVPLEESLALWERGEALAQRCQDWLDGARQRLDSARENPARDNPARENPALPGDGPEAASQVDELGE